MVFEVFCPSLFWFKDCIHSDIALVLNNELVRLTEWKENVYVSSREDWFWVQDTYRLQQYVNCELPDVQTGFRKGRGTRDQIANICWIIEKARVPEKHLLLLYWLCQSLWTVWITTNRGKFWKRWEYQTTWPSFWEICMQVRKQQLELDMEQQTGSK